MSSEASQPTSSAEPRRLVVLISGSGTNLQALIDALPSSSSSDSGPSKPLLPHTTISLVVSNRKAAFGLTRAQNATPPIPTAYLALQPYLKQNPSKTREDYDREVAKIVCEARPDVVVLAGWMHVLSQVFLDELESYSASASSSPSSSHPRKIEVVNLHPALPGAFDGSNAIHRAYAAFQAGEIDHSGVMLHRVVKEVDRGEPVLVREVEIKKGESEEEFERRVHETEWGVVVEGVRRVLDEVRPVE